MTDFVNGGISRSVSQSFASTNRFILRGRGATSSRGYASPAIAFDVRGLSESASESRGVPTGHWGAWSVNASESRGGTRFTGALGAKGLSQAASASRAGLTRAYSSWRGISRPNDVRGHSGTRAATQNGGRSVSASAARCRLGRLAETAGLSQGLSYGFGIMRLRAYSGWSVAPAPSAVWTVTYPES